MSEQNRSSHELFPAGSERTASVDRQKGGGLSVFEYTRSWERANVVSVHPEKHSCDLYTERGKLVEDVAWYNLATEICPPGLGTQWFVQFQGARASITPAPPMVGMPAQPKQDVSNVPGISSQYRTTDDKKGVHANFSGSGQVDVLPGDRLLKSPSGNFLGILNDGINIMKSGEFCKIETHEFEERVKLVGRNIELFSGPGRLTLNTDEEQNKDGKTTKSKTSLEFAIGTDTEEESAPRSENFRIRYRAGQSGNISCFQITDGKGTPTYEHQIFPDGRVDSKMDALVERVANTRATFATGTVMEASRSSTYKAGQRLNLEAGGAVRVKSFGRVSIIAAGGNISAQTTRALSMTAGSGMSFRANGGFLPLPINRALEFQASNGSVSFSIGNPAAGELPLSPAASSFLANTYGINGNIRLSSLLGGVSLDSNIPGGVKIGGPSLGPHPAPGYPAPFAAVLFETLLLFMNAFGAAIDGHIHPYPQGAANTLPPAPVLPYTSTAGMLTAARSTFVSIGG